MKRRVLKKRLSHIHTSLNLGQDQLTSKGIKVLLKEVAL